MLREELFLGCDANFNHVRWDSTNVNRREKNLHDFIINTNLTWGLELNFMDYKKQEVIDMLEETGGPGGYLKNLQTQTSGTLYFQYRRKMRLQLQKLNRLQDWSKGHPK